MQSTTQKVEGEKSSFFVNEINDLTGNSGENY